MKKLLLPLFLGLLNSLQGQQLKFFNSRSGTGVADYITAIFPTDSNTVWLQTGWNYPLMAVRQDSIALFPSSVSGLNPEWNAPVAGFSLEGGRQILIPRLTNGTVHPGFGQANGGVLQYNGTLFSLANAQNTFALSEIRDAQWYCAAMDVAKRFIWLGGDSGIRRIDRQGFATKLFRPSSFGRRNGIPERAISLADTSVLFQTIGGRWLRARGDTVVEFNQSTIGLNGSYYLSQLLVTSGSDTFFLANGPNGWADKPMALYKCVNHTAVNQTELYPQLPENIRGIASEKDGSLWAFGTNDKIYRLRNGSVDSFSIGIADKEQIMDLKIDPYNRKWMATSGSGAIFLSDVSARISIRNSPGYCTGARISFVDSSKTIGRGIVSRRWNFGDGQTSTDLNPQHLYNQPGRYLVSLLVTDQNGCFATATDTLVIKPLPYLNIRQPLKTNSCGAIPLHAYGEPDFRWLKPNGTIQTSNDIEGDQTGWYVAVANLSGCSKRDSVFVNIQPQNLELELTIQTADGEEIADDNFAAFFPFEMVASPSPLQEVCAGSWKLNNAPMGDSLRQRIVFPEPGQYRLEWRGINSDSCIRFAFRNFTFSEPTIPNLVTVNGDGINDLFQVKGTRISTLSLFNRWGKEIFSAEPYQNNWPGSDVTAGTYFYRLTAGDKNYQGWVEVVK